MSDEVIHGLIAKFISTQIWLNIIQANLLISNRYEPGVEALDRKLKLIIIRMILIGRQQFIAEMAHYRDQAVLDLTANPIRVAQTVSSLNRGIAWLK